MMISVALTNKLKIPTIAVCNIWMCLINHKMCVCIEDIIHNNSTFVNFVTRTCKTYEMKMKDRTFLEIH